MTEAEVEAWCAKHRLAVANYLQQQEGLHHGAIGEWPAWRITPDVSLWAVESVRKPGAIGWWVICGDLPIDYCSADDCRIPRQAVAKIANRWASALRGFRAGDPVIGELGIDGALAPLLRSRAELLLRFTSDPNLWPDEPT